MLEMPKHLRNEFIIFILVRTQQLGKYNIQIIILLGQMLLVPEQLVVLQLVQQPSLGHQLVLIDIGDHMNQTELQQTVIRGLMNLEYIPE